MTRHLAYRVSLIAGLVMLTLSFGIIGFHQLEGYSWFDAFYMTLITMTTVGYQEVHPLTHAGRTFNSFFILFGVSAMFLAVGLVTHTAVELQLKDFYARRRRGRMIKNLNNHIIVCGFGRVGRNASHELLRARVPFVVIDRSAERVERASAAGMLALSADATRDECLRDVGIMRARGFVAALPTDAENLFVILSAKTLNPKLTVATRAAEEDAEPKLRRAGADTVYSPYSLVGQRLAQALVRPRVTHILDFASKSLGLDVEMEELPLAPDSEFISKSIGVLLATLPVSVIVLAVRRADNTLLFNPPFETPI